MSINETSPEFVTCATFLVVTYAIIRMTRARTLTPLRILACLGLSLVTFVLLSRAAVVAWTVARLMVSGVETSGVIVQEHAFRGGTGRGAYSSTYTTVQFAGGEREIDAYLGEKGQTVPVVYLPSQPDVFLDGHKGWTGFWLWLSHVGLINLFVPGLLGLVLWGLVWSWALPDPGVKEGAAEAGAPFTDAKGSSQVAGGTCVVCGQRLLLAMDGELGTDGAVRCNECKTREG